MRQLLDSYPDHLQLVEALPQVGGPGLTGSHSTMPCELYLSHQEAALVQRFDPSGPQETIGFFIAKFRKTASML